MNNSQISKDYHYYSPLASVQRNTAISQQVTDGYLSFKLRTLHYNIIIEQMPHININAISETQYIIYTTWPHT